jgi:hypothetical protein
MIGITAGAVTCAEGAATAIGATDLAILATANWITRADQPDRTADLFPNTLAAGRTAFPITTLRG